MTSKTSKGLEPRPPAWKVWFVAARPHTLTASIAPNIVGYNAGIVFLSNLDHSTYFWLTMEWTAFCMLMQLGTNLHNDYADFVKGADNEKRVGQPRATQKGWLTPYQTAMASGATLFLGLCLGILFLFQMMARDDNGPDRLAFMVVIVVTSIFNAFAYTGGPWPLGYIGLEHFSIGYSGLGDLFVFLYFGLVATLTLPFLYVTTSSPSKTTTATVASISEILWAFAPYAVQVAVLATNIIVVNNLRDRHTDVLANKRTLAVRLGATFCRVEYLMNVVVAFGLVLWEAYSTQAMENSSQSMIPKLLPLLSLPLALKEWKAICTKEGSALNPHVGGAAKVQLIFCISLAISIRL